MKFKTQIQSDVSTGTAPLSVASTTVVSNLNADKWDSQDLPSITANGGKVLAVNSGATALEWISAGGSTTASGVSVSDAGSYFTGTNVETVLQEVGPIVFNGVYAGTSELGTPIAVNADTLNGHADTYFAPQSIVPLKNWIINGGFDVWQRSTSQTASGIASDDRWGNMYFGSTSVHSRQTFTVGQTDVPNNPKYFSRTVVTSVAGADNYASKSQLIEDVTKLASKSVSVSFWAKADASKNIAIELYQYFGATSGFVTAIGSQKFALTTSWQRFTATITIPSSIGKTVDNVTSYLALRFWFDAGSTYNTNSATLGHQSGTFDLSNITVVEGTSSQEWQTETYADVLSQCQRYYCLISSLSGTGNSYEQFGIGSADSATSINVSVNLPITMRVPPTVIDYVLPFRVHNGGSATSVTSMSIQTIFTSANKVGVACVYSGMTINNFYTLSRNNSTSATLGFSAEL